MWHMFYEVNPYENFNPEGQSTEIDIWNVDPAFFTYLFEQVKPKLIVEVGSWKGASAICMGLTAKKLNLKTQIICVDTWLGSFEHLTQQEFRRLLTFQNGRPVLYEQFLANIIRMNLQDSIIPVPQTSETAYKMLKLMNLYPDLIYVDAAHDYESVSRDVKMYFELLRSGGVLVGDDYHIDSVKQAADHFAQQNALNLYSNQDKFLIQKS